MKGKAMGSSRMNAITALVMTGLLAGCATTAQPTTEDTEAFASRIIADKVALAVSSQHNYVAALNADRAKAASRQAAIDTDQVDIDFIGKPQELLQTLATRYGYRYVEIGKRVDLKPVNVWVRKATPVNVLRDVGVQIDQGADVVLDKSTGTVRLVYKQIAAVRG